MTREERLADAKKRALVYLEKGDKFGATTSLMSDFRKYDIYPEVHMCMELLVVCIMNPDEMNAKAVNGFN